MVCAPQFLTCPYCKGNATLQSGVKVHGPSYPAPMFICENYPACDSYVRCHDGTDLPMGTIAGKRLRKLRSIAHQHFDPLWQATGNELGRSAAYAAAGAAMRCDGEFHIGNLDEAGCETFIERIQFVELEMDRRLEAHFARGAPPSEMTLEVLHALFHPDRDTFLSQIKLATIAAYDSVWSEAKRCGLVVQQEFEVKLTQKGVGLVYDPST